MRPDDLMAEQYGLIARSQALDLGLSRHQIDRRVQRGAWLIVERGVYRHRAVPASWHNRVLGAVLTTGGVASHRCASALWSLDVFRHPRPEITVPEGCTRRSRNAIVHRSTQFDRCNATVRANIPCTGVERTILDCGAVTTLRRVERLAEAAIRQRLTSWPDLARCLQRHSRRGRDGCGTLRSLLEARLTNQTIPLSDFSRLVSNLLVDHGLPEPVLEYPIVDRAGAHILQVDLAWPQRRKAWELDGLRYHFGRTDIERDKRKRNRAIAEGWTIQRSSGRCTSTNRTSWWPWPVDSSEPPEIRGFDSAERCKPHEFRGLGWRCVCGQRVVWNRSITAGQSSAASASS